MLDAWRLGTEPLHAFDLVPGRVARIRVADRTEIVRGAVKLLVVGRSETCPTELHIVDWLSWGRFMTCHYLR
jgi:hypothetical protein